MPDIETKQVGEEIAKQVYDLAAEEITTQIKASEAEVRAAALELVSYGMSLQIAYQQAQQIQNRIETAGDGFYNEALRFNRKMVQTYEEFKELMTRVFKLQNIINSFLGQEVQMIFTYIDKNGKVELYKMENDVEHLTIGRASTSHGGGITGRYQFSKSTLAKMAQVINTNYDSTSLDTTFAEVYRRYKISKSRLKQGGAFYIFWKENSEWSGVRVTSAGVLGEAYTAFFLAEYIFQSMIEAAVGDFMTNSKYGATAADNISGFLEGDISKGNIQYGVKAKGATALGYMDIIHYAQEILAAPDLTQYLTGVDGKGGLKQKLRDAGAKNLAQKLPDVIDGTFEEILSALKKI